MTPTEPFWHTTTALHTCQDECLRIFFIKTFIMYCGKGGKSSCQTSARSLHSHRWLASLLGRVLDHEPTTCTLYMCPVLWIPVPPPKTPHWGLSDKTKQNLAAVRMKPQNTSSKLLSGAYLRQFSNSHWSENMRPRIIHHTISPQASKSRTNLVFCSLRKVQPLFFFHNTHQPSNLKLARK